MMLESYCIAARVLGDQVLGDQVLGARSLGDQVLGAVEMVSYYRDTTAGHCFGAFGDPGGGGPPVRIQTSNFLSIKLDIVFQYTRWQPSIFYPNKRM